MYNAFSEQGENCDELFHLLPSFRKELLDEASKKDLDGCYDYVKKIKETIGEIPGELQAIYNEILPVNKQFVPILTSVSTETDNVLSETAKEFFKFAKTSGLSRSENESENKTVAIVKYCWNLAEAHQRQNALNHYEYLVKQDEVSMEMKNKKRLQDEELLEGFLAHKFPKRAKINTAYAELQAEKNAEEAAEKSNNDS